MTERLASVDPGDPHVGTAIWESANGRWVCTAAREVTPDRFVDSLYKLLSDGLIQRVAYEVYRMTGGHESAHQFGSTFPTVEVIGAARHLARWHGIVLEPIERDQRKATLLRMRAAGWRFPRGAPTHVKDAIAVGAAATGWSAVDHFDGDGVRNI